VNHFVIQAMIEEDTFPEESSEVPISPSEPIILPEEETIETMTYIIHIDT